MEDFVSQLRREISLLSSAPFMAGTIVEHAGVSSAALIAAFEAARDNPGRVLEEPLHALFSRLAGLIPHTHNPLKVLKNLVQLHLNKPTEPFAQALADYGSLDSVRFARVLMPEVNARNPYACELADDLLEHAVFTREGVMRNLRHLFVVLFGIPSSTEAIYFKYELFKRLANEHLIFDSVFRQAILELRTPGIGPLCEEYLEAGLELQPALRSNLASSFHSTPLSNISVSLAEWFLDPKPELRMKRAAHLARVIRDLPDPRLFFEDFYPRATLAPIMFASVLLDFSKDGPYSVMADVALDALMRQPSLTRGKPIQPDYFQGLGKQLRYATSDFNLQARKSRILTLLAHEGVVIPKPKDPYLGIRPPSWREACQRQRRELRAGRAYI